MKAMWEEFKKFVMRGNVIDMAVGVIVGGAFGAIAKSLVTDVIMPPIGLLLGGVDFGNLFIVLKQGSLPGPYPTLVDAQAAGAVTINYGLFFNTVINFLIIAFVIFMLIKGINALKKKEEPTPPPPPSTKKCPFCLSEIPLEATRCAFCTSELPPVKS